MLNVVAHQDDDLLFMNPDIQRDIDARRCTLTVFVTAGDAGAGQEYWKQRENGPRAAYAMMADIDDKWSGKNVKYGHFTVEYESLTANPDVALAYLRAPDGGGGGYSRNNGESLDELYRGVITEIHSVDGVNTYTRAGITTLLLDIMRSYQPDTIQTLDYSDKYRGTDHGDHRTTAYLTFEAHLQYKTPHRISAYLAYAVMNLPANVYYTADNRKLDIFRAYADHDPKVCQTTGACHNSVYDIRAFRQYLTSAEEGGALNVARIASMSASSQNTASGQTAAKAVNGSTKGWPVSAGDEWQTTRGKAGSWISGKWANVQTIDKVVLYYRPNGSDQITAGTLTFSDGTSIKVGALPNDGQPKVVSFSPRRVWTFKFTATAVSPTTGNAGLAEIQAFSTSVAPQAAITASSQNNATNQQVYRAIDGYTTGAGIPTNREWATTGGRAGSWLKLTWPQPRTINRIVLHDRPNGKDQITGGTLNFSDGSRVEVPSLPNNGAAQTITFSKRTVTSVTLNVTR